MMKRSTTAKDLQKLFNEYMVIVTSDKQGHQSEKRGNT